jgi:hypothetical protein
MVNSYLYIIYLAHVNYLGSRHINFFSFFSCTPPESDKWFCCVTASFFVLILIVKTVGSESLFPFVFEEA